MDSTKLLNLMASAAGDLTFGSDITVEQIIYAVKSKAVESALNEYEKTKAGPSAGEKKATTIRINREVAVFYQTFADCMGVSLQEAISVMLSGFVEASRAQTASTSSERKK